MPNILCAGPGPHAPASGVIGTIDNGPDRTVAGMLCQAAACQATPVAANAAATTLANNQAAIQAAIDARLGQIEAFIATNPGGATLTGPQTITLAKMLVGLARLVRNNVGSIGQAG